MKATLALLITLAFMGCSHVLQLTPTSTEGDLKRANKQVSDWKGTISLSNGDSLLGEDFRINKDTIRWHEIEPELADALRASGFTVKAAATYAQPVGNVQHLKIRNITRGMRDGIVFGFLLGFVAGSAVDLADPTSSSTWALFNGSKYPTARTAGAAFLGAAAGAVAGSFLTSPTTIRFVNFAK